MSRTESTTPNIDTAIGAWGSPLPAWIQVLAEECDRTSQGKTAARLKRSPTVINQALKKTYTGRLDDLEQRVRGELMGETVSCPILAEITKRECLDHQARGYESTNATRVRLFQACRKCPNRSQS